jgi:DNA-directed RNA polymerase specialized sigma subunit
MKNFVILVNSEVLFEKNKSVFNDEEIKEIFKEELKDNNFEFEDEEVDLECGINYLKERERLICYNCFIDKGNDYSEISIEEVVY